MALAIFDLDNTLIKGDSDYLWGEFLIQKGAVNADVFQAENERFYKEYKKGTLDIFEYQHFSLGILAQYDLDILKQWQQEFLSSTIQQILQPKAQACVDKHRQQGDTLLIITATNSFVTRPIGQFYGIENLIGTDGEIKNKRFTGQVLGTPSFQNGKVLRLNEWLEKHPFDLNEAYFYSDSRNDLPLLEKVGHPIVVDGDETLLTVAKQKSWPAISFH